MLPGQPSRERRRGPGEPGPWLEDPISLLRREPEELDPEVGDDILVDAHRRLGGSAVPFAEDPDRANRHLEVAGLLDGFLQELLEELFVIDAEVRRRGGLGQSERAVQRRQPLPECAEGRGELGVGARRGP